MDNLTMTDITRETLAFQYVLTKRRWAYRHLEAELRKLGSTREDLLKYCHDGAWLANAGLTPPPDTANPQLHVGLLCGALTRAAEKFQALRAECSHCKGQSDECPNCADVHEAEMMARAAARLEFGI